MGSFKNLSNEEIAYQIKQYGGNYDLTSNLSAQDQLWICEILASVQKQKSSIYEYEEKPYGIKDNSNVYESGNDTCKFVVNFELNDSKLTVIERLRACNSKTPPIEVATLLKDFFAECGSKEGHWLYVAQTWPPRRIHLTINRMLKRQSGGWTMIQNPAAYFTHLIKFRKKRRSVYK